MGLFVKPGPGVQKACDENAVVIKAESTTVTIKPSGVVIDGDVTINGSLTTKGGTVNLN